MINTANAVTNPMLSVPPTANALVRDLDIWPVNSATRLYDIATCWENKTSVPVTYRTWTYDALKASWANPSVSGIRFLGYDTVKKMWLKPTDEGQCPTTFFPGVRVKSDPNDSHSPYVTALGTSLLQHNNTGQYNHVVLDYQLTKNAIFLTSCKATLPVSYTAAMVLQQCIKSEIVHEFGHVIGISHEQNRAFEITDPVGSYGFCARNDDDPSILGTHVIGRL